MSTILKALRQLEHEKPPATADPFGDVVEPDPTATPARARKRKPRSTAAIGLGALVASIGLLLLGIALQPLFRPAPAIEVAQTNVRPPAAAARVAPPVTAATDTVAASAAPQASAAKRSGLPASANALHPTPSIATPPEMEGQAAASAVVATVVPSPTLRAEEPTPSAAEGALRNVAPETLVAAPPPRRQAAIRRATPRTGKPAAEPAAKSAAESVASEALRVEPAARRAPEPAAPPAVAVARAAEPAPDRTAESALAAVAPQPIVAAREVETPSVSAAAAPVAAAVPKLARRSPPTPRPAAKPAPTPEPARAVATTSPPAIAPPPVAEAAAERAELARERAEAALDSPAARAPLDPPVLLPVRTSWHPKPERREARLEAVSGEAQVVHEGDDVDGYTVVEISPSAVVFERGGETVRVRVGTH